MLRVFLSAPPVADRADPWVRYAGDGRVVARGRDIPARWPDDPRLEVVLAAAQVRLAALALPPMPRDRLRHAARYALEDQMASTADEATIAVARSDARDAVVAAIADAALIAAIATHPRRVASIVAESALAPCGDGWTWCASAAGGGFVRREDGSAFAVGDAHEGNLPAELRTALALAQRANDAPAAVHVALPGDAARIAQWSQVGVPFVAAPAWHWERATQASFADAPDFAANDAPTNARRAGSRAAQSFRPALLLAAAALVIHSGGSLAHWAWLGFVDWRLSRAIVAEAAAAGLPDATTASAAFAAIARRNAELRHRVSKPAPDDALPLLARAAPSLAALPPGTLRSATYANGVWTIELAKLDPDAVSRVTRELRRSGIDAVSAPIAAGTRMRVALDATAR